MYVRNDSVSQLIVEVVRDDFDQKNVIQEFTKSATPEQYAHIESYHSLIERVSCQKYELDTLTESQEVFQP